MYFLPIIGKAKLEDVDNPDWIPTQSMGYVLKKKTGNIARATRLVMRLQKTANIVVSDDEKAGKRDLCIRFMHHVTSPKCH